MQSALIPSPSYDAFSTLHSESSCHLQTVVYDQIEGDRYCREEAPVTKQAGNSSHLDLPRVQIIRPTQTHGPGRKTTTSPTGTGPMGQIDHHRVIAEGKGRSAYIQLGPEAARTVPPVGTPSQLKACRPLAKGIVRNGGPPSYQDLVVPIWTFKKQIATSQNTTLTGQQSAKSELKARERAASATKTFNAGFTQGYTAGRQDRKKMKKREMAAIQKAAFEDGYMQGHKESWEQSQQGTPLELRNSSTLSHGQLRSGSEISQRPLSRPLPIHYCR